MANRILRPSGKEKPWHTVKTVDYYGAYEKAGTLKGGDLVDVSWPDKSWSTHTLIEQVGIGSAQVDMNRHLDYFPTRHLYVQVALYGLPVKLPLLGLKIRYSELNQKK